MTKSVAHRRCGVARTLVALMVGSVLMAVMAGSHATAVAQDERFELTILGLTCDADPGEVAFGDQIPEGCSPTEDSQFDRYPSCQGQSPGDCDQEHALGSCTSGADGICTMLVPTFQPYVIYERTPPEGTVPQHTNGIEIGIPSASLGIVFVNIRDETSPPPDPTEPPDTTELPDTGAGLTALAAPGDAWVPVLLAGALLLIIGGVHFRAPLER